MSALGWLRERDDGVPGALRERLRARITRGELSDESDNTDALIRAATGQLTLVLNTHPMTRAQALDLLAADAFATYALEAAADDPATLARRADAAMQSFATVR